MFLSTNLDNARFNDARQEEGHIDKSYKARSKMLKKTFFDHLTKVHVCFYANELPLQSAEIDSACLHGETCYR